MIILFVVDILLVQTLGHHTFYLKNLEASIGTFIIDALLTEVMIVSSRMWLILLLWTHKVEKCLKYKIHVKYNSDNNNNNNNYNNNVIVPLKVTISIIDWLTNANNTIGTIGNFIFMH